jgi:DNA-damage-inducible protein J
MRAWIKSDVRADDGAQFISRADVLATIQFVRARSDERIKKEAETVLATVGLTVSDAFRLLMVRVARDKALPFERLVPNKKTIEAIKAGRRGGRPRGLLTREASHRPQVCVAVLVELIVRVAHGLGLAPPQHDLEIDRLEAVVLITMDHAGRA